MPSICVNQWRLRIKIDLLQKYKDIATEARRHREYQSNTPSLCVSAAQSVFSDAPTTTYAKGLINIKLESKKRS